MNRRLSGHEVESHSETMITKLILAAVAVELIVGGILLSNMVGSDDFTNRQLAVRVGLLLGPALILITSLLPFWSHHRRMVIAFGAVAVLAQCAWLVFGTGPIYPFVLMLVLGAWWLEGSYARNR